MWLFAIALFVTLFFATDLPHPWLVFLFALPAQVAMVATIFGRSK